MSFPIEPSNEKWDTWPLLLLPLLRVSYSIVYSSLHLLSPVSWGIYIIICHLCFFTDSQCLNLSCALVRCLQGRPATLVSIFLLLYTLQFRVLTRQHTSTVSPLLFLEASTTTFPLSSLHCDLFRPRFHTAFVHPCFPYILLAILLTLIYFNKIMTKYNSELVNYEEVQKPTFP